MATKRRGLGRDLNALLGSANHVSTDNTAAHDGELKTIATDVIVPSPYQPRKHMTQAALDDLAQSIRSQGIIQPIVVRYIKAQAHYELIAGERRWRAAKQAGLTEIPALVRDIDDQTASALALIENIQRENLNPIEEAEALQRLLEDFSMTHQQVADVVGRSRVAVSNLLRLLNLDQSVKLLLINGDIEMGHARAILSLTLEQQLKLAHTVVERGLSVRETERLAKLYLSPPVKNAASSPRDPDIAHLEKRLNQLLNTKVSVKHDNKGRGKITIAYNTVEALEAILTHIK